MRKSTVSKLVLLSSAASLAACQTTEPLNGAGIGYHLPRTDAKVALSLTLRDCRQLWIGPDPKNPTKQIAGKDAVDAELTLEPAPGAQPGWYRIDGKDLASSHIKRDLELTVDENSVISGVNSANTEVSPDTSVTVAKTVAAIAGAAVGMPAVAGRPVAPPSTPTPLILCLDKVADAADRVQQLRNTIRELGQTLSDGTAGPGTEDRIQALAQEIGTLEAGILRLSIQTKLSLDKGLSGGEVTLDPNDFDKWFGPPLTDDDANVQEQHRKDRVADLNRLFGLGWVVTNFTPTKLEMPIPRKKKKTFRTCGLAMAVPQASQADLAVEPKGAMLSPKLKAKKTLTGAQWSDPGELCLDVGFGESRTMKVAFDKFGRTTSFSWSSSASATAASTMAAGLVEQGVGLYTTVNGRDLAADKAELDRLTTSQSLAKARACQALLDAGKTCPAE